MNICELNIKPITKKLKKGIIASNSILPSYVKVKTKYSKSDDWTCASLYGYGKNSKDIFKPGVFNKIDKKKSKLQLTELGQLLEVDGILNKLPCEVERVRLMKLKSEKVIGKHTDKIDKEIESGKIVRIHLPIKTNNKVVFTQYENAKDKVGKEHHLKQGHFYFVDVSKPHAVKNESKEDRIHLVIDCFSNDKLRNLVSLGKKVA